jgi:hypothetical protein
MVTGADRSWRLMVERESPIASPSDLRARSAVGLSQFLAQQFHE